MPQSPNRENVVVKWKKYDSSMQAKMILIPILIFTIVFLGLGIISNTSEIGQENIRAEENQETINQEKKLPAGVNRDNPDSIGMFVARATYNIDMNVDRNSDSALLRNADMVLTQKLKSSLEESQRAGTFVQSTKWDQMREKGITSWNPSYPALVEEKDEANRASRTYAMNVFPVFNDQKTGSPVKITVTIVLVKSNQGWYANNVTIKD